MTKELIVESLLACPACKGALSIRPGPLACSCGFKGEYRNNILLARPTEDLSFFDGLNETMVTGNKGPGVKRLCYDRQVSFVEHLLAPDQVVLDVGCGPTLPYRNEAGAFIVGLESSYEGIGSNRQIDLGIFGDAATLPLQNDSVDVIVCFYSLHHMVGETMTETRGNLDRAFREFGRVLKQGGQLCVFEICPWPVTWLFERVVWNSARRILGSRLDMFFWAAEPLSALGQNGLPDAQFELVGFPTPALTVFPPAFSLPWLKLPRFLYPFSTKLYHWTN